MRANVVLIVLDTARADAFEPYGAASGATPTVAQLAGRGAAHPAMYAPSNWTMPSHASLFSGRLPRDIGLSRAPDGQPIRCRPLVEALADRWLPEVLRRAGLSTRAASANRWISARTGFGQGFDEFVDLQGRHYERINDPHPWARLRWAMAAMAARADAGTRHATEVVERWLADPPDRPFFWFVNLLECHSPYLPPRPYNDLPLRSRLRAGEDARRFLTLGSILHACAGGLTVPEDTLERMRHLYGRAIRSMDDWLAWALERLDATGLLDDTLVIVTSDHGENLGECGLMGHTLSLDERLIRVPFVAAGPGAPAGSDVTSLASVPRLVAEAAGLERHPWEGDELPHLAVAQYDGLPPGPKVHDTVASWGMGDATVRRLTTALTAVTDGRLKLVRTGTDDERLFDLGADHLEQRPLDPGAVDPRALAELRKVADDAAFLSGEVDAGDDDPGGESHDDEMDGLEDQLRLLGYL